MEMFKVPIMEHRPNRSVADPFTILLRNDDNSREVAEHWGVSILGKKRIYGFPNPDLWVGKSGFNPINLVFLGLL